MADIFDPSTWSFPSFGSDIPEPVVTPKTDRLPAAVQTTPKTGRVPTEAERLAADLAQINAANSNADAQALLALSKQRGNDLTANNQLLNDYRDLPPIEFQQRYGQDIYERVVASKLGEREVNRLAGTTRDPEQHLADDIMALGSGAVQGALGLNGMLLQGMPGLGPVGPRLSTKNAELAQTVKEFMDGEQTPELNRLRFVDSLRGELDRQDNENRYEKDKEADGELVADLRSFGRGVLSGGGRLLEDPAMLETGVAEGVGSMLLGGPVSRGVATTAKAANRVINPSLTEFGAKAVDDAIEKAVFPLTIAGMEGGGAANQAIQEVMAIPEAELQKQPAYQELLASGMSPDAARRQIADRAGSIASVPAALVGAATGKLVEKIETRPFASTNPVGLGVNAAKEALEESVQSGVGEFASNLGERFSGANPDNMLSEGVGDAAIQGGIFGAGTVGATQGPGVALKQSAKAAGLTLKHTVGAGVKGLIQLGEKRLANLAAEASVSPEKLAPVVQEAAANAPAIGEALRAAAAQNGANTEEAESYIARVQNAAKLREGDLATVPAGLVNDLNEYAKGFDRPINRFEALGFMAAVAENAENTEAERIAAGAFLIKNIEDNKKIFTQDFPDFMDKLSHDSQEFQAFDQYARILQAIEQTPSIRDALKWAHEQMQMPEQDLTSVDLNSDEGREIVNNVVNVASVAPQAVNQKTVEGILLQADNGILELSREQRSALRGATALLNADRVFAARNRVPELGPIESQAQELQVELDQARPRDELMDFVGRQINEEGGARKHQLSLVQHTNAITQAVSQGDMNAAKRAVQHLSKFARSHRNKIAAANQSIANGDGRNVAYQAFDGVEDYTNKKGWGVVVGNEGSERAARKIHAEAVAIAQLANDFAAQYPEFGVSQIQVPALALDRNNKRGSSPDPRITETGATTPQSSEINAVQEELPLPPSQTARETGGVASAVETDVPVSTEQSENVSSEPAAVQKIVEQPVAVVVETVEVPVEPVTETVVSVPEPEESAPVETVIEQAVTEPVLEDAESALAEAAPILPTISDRYPLLVQPAGTNWFQKAFKLPEQAKSRMVDLVQPLQSFLDIMRSSQRLITFMGRDVDYEVSGQTSQSFQELLRKGDGVLSHMKARLKEKVVGDKLLEKLNAGEDWVIRTRDLRALNLLDKTPTGYRYNPELIETAVIAGLDWVLNAQDRAVPMSTKDVADLLGIEEDYVQKEHLDAFNRGISLDVAKRSLADRIVKFWGVDANKDVKEDYVRGIPEAIAAEVLHGLGSIGLIDLGIKTKDEDKRLKFPGLTEKTFNRVLFDARSEADQALIKSLDGASTLLEDMALINKEIEGYSIGQPVTDIDQRQLRNGLVKTTKQQKKALENVQNTPYYPNHVMFDLVQALGEEAFVTLLSKREYRAGDLTKDHTEMGLNKVHWESVKGLQRQLVNSFRNTTKQMSAVRAHGDNVPTYYKHHINKLGRLQMAGLSNPQSDKLARELFMATRSTLDLSGTAPDMEKFLMTIGQGIGLKTEKLTRNEVTFEVMNQTSEGGKLYPLVQALQTWLLANQDGAGQDIPLETYQLLQAADLSMHGIHSMVALARYNIAPQLGIDLARFETFSYLEADGKTNGPINSMMLMAAGAITPEWLKQIGKGGAYFGRSGKTLNSHEDKVDLYEDGAVETQVNIVELGNRIQDSNLEVHELFTQFQRFLASLDANVTMKDGEITIKRGLTKNPLTITIYGSGANGIAGKVLDELLGAMYEQLSKSIETGTPAGDLIYGEGSSNQFMQDLADLSGKLVKRNLGGTKFWLEGRGSTIRGSAQDFELSPQQRKVLVENVRTFLVDPMRDAIEAKVTQHVGDTTKAVQEATQLQSIILRGMFMREISQTIARMKADPEKYDYRDGDFLSQNQMDEIHQKLMPFSPIIETGSQSYFLSGGEKSDLFHQEDENGKTVPYIIEFEGKEVKITMPESFARSLSGDMSTPAYAYGPTLAGVSAIPTLVVGSGDGQMMLNANADGMERTLHVFDGLNMPADQIDDYSTRINEAVFKTWTSNANPVRAVADSFAEFLRNRPIENLFDGQQNPFQQEALIDIARSFLNKREVDREDIDSVDPERYFQSVLTRLDDLADQIDARRKTYAEFGMSVDQMASGESPFTNPGKFGLPENASHELIAHRMTIRYERNLAAIRRAKQAASEADAVEQAEENQEEVELQVLQSSDLPDLVKSMAKTMTPTQKEMARQAAKLLQGSGYQVVVGSTEQLDAWEQENNADRFVPGSNDYYGKVDPISKIILISNMASETFVHELIHAATIDKVKAAYDQSSALSKEELEAVGRIEGLMNEWLQLDYSREFSPVYDARRMAENAIAGHLNAGRKAEALNEFMAWVLANQHLSETAKKTKIRNPILRIVGDALAALKALIWGAPNKGPRVGDNLLSNLRFNTRILMATPTRTDLLKQDFAQVALYQSPIFGSSDRLSELRHKFQNRIIAWTQEGNAKTPQGFRQNQVREREALKAKQEAEDLAGVFAYHFPELGNMQAFSTFSAIQTALMTEMELNSNALSRMEDLYAHVLDKLEWSDFRENDDPNDPNDQTQAHDKFNVLDGVFGTKTDKLGRSSLMSSFLALAMTSDQFRLILSKMEKPKADREDSTTLDARLENLGNAALDRLSILMAGEKGSDSNVRDALDRLTLAMIENVGDQRSYIEQQAEGGFGRLEKYLADGIQDLSDKAIKATSKVLKSNKPAPVRAAAGLGNLVATMINEQAAEEAQLGMVSWLNRRQGLNPLKEFVADIVGRTRENATIFDMISKVRAEVQQARQQFRDELPKKLASMFTKPVSQAQWTAMFKSLGKTDLASLAGAYGVQGALEMITDQARLAGEIQRLESVYGQALIGKSKQLAHFMLTGEHGTKLLRNAHAIVGLTVRGVKNLTPDPSMVDDIDRLVTLYAIQGLDQETKATVTDLIRNQKDGVEFAANYLVGQRVDELAKVNKSKLAQLNHYKGHIPSEAKQGGSLMIASDSEHAHLVSRGYTRIGAYTGSSADRVLGKRSYYFAPVSGLAPFSQGVLQTVHQTASGIDPETGYTVGEVMAGRIEDPQMIRLIERQLANQSSTRENLLPVFDDTGRVIAYERAADPEKLEKLNRSTDLAQMIGVWRGRQIEEMLAQAVNEQLVDNLKDIWERDRKLDKTKEFVNIAKLDPRTDDRVLIEASRLVPNQTREYIKDVFGPDQFMVRRDMLLDTFGARQASIGDLFSGKTRWNPKTIENFEKLAAGVLGTNAYTYLVSAEKNVQEFIGNAKTLIVVKSVIVPAANLVSNMFQLLNRGVPIREIIKGVPAKTAEINSYIKRRKQEIDLEADLRAAKGKNDLVAIRTIQNKLRSIQDSYKRMSIWPLIEAGEFSAISNGQVTAEDLALADGKWTNFVERKIAELPDGLRTPARYAFITRDTALFQGLARAVQYGDFVAKAVLYDDLTRRKKAPKDDAVATVNEAFVNYNRLAGRSRQYLESVGLLWFYNYKLRIMKEAAYMLRHNPLRSLLVTSVPGLPVIGSIGSPVSDNFLALFNDGKLDYSIGPSMGLHSFSLNPWINMVR